MAWNRLWISWCVLLAVPFTAFAFVLYPFILSGFAWISRSLWFSLFVFIQPPYSSSFYVHLRAVLHRFLLIKLHATRYCACHCAAQCKLAFSFRLKFILSSMAFALVPPWIVYPLLPSTQLVWGITWNWICTLNVLLIDQCCGADFELLTGAQNVFHIQSFTTTG